MLSNNIKRTNNSSLSYVSGKLFTFTIGLIAIFVCIQFVKLATVGRIGVDISKIKHNQEETELSNEILRMEINKLRSASNLSLEISKEENLVKKNPKIIKGYNTNVVALK